ncbi:MAG: hypothetical protein K8M05_07860 [Deltaproteobacteria bacterium]|nr:hypothetical protein [Kofleriaceae bacterium]
MRTEDDEELLGAERTSMIVMILILLGLMLVPDRAGCPGQASSARSAPTTVSTDSVVAP